MSNVTNLDEHTRQRLSELTDDELAHAERDQALDRLAVSEAQQASWSRYHLIRDTMQASLPEGIDLELRERVQSAIAAEMPPGRSLASGWMRPVAGVALAASVAVVSLIGIRWLHGSDGEIAQPVAQTPALTLPESQLSRDRLGAYLVRHGDYSRGVMPYVHLISQDGEGTQ